MLKGKSKASWVVLIALVAAISATSARSQVRTKDPHKEAEARRSREAAEREIREVCAKAKRRYEYAEATLRGRIRRGAPDEMLSASRKEFDEALREYCECLRMEYAKRNLPIPEEYHRVCTPDPQLLPHGELPPFADPCVGYKDKFRTFTLLKKTAGAREAELAREAENYRRWYCDCWKELNGGVLPPELVEFCEGGPEPTAFPPWRDPRKGYYAGANVGRSLPRPSAPEPGARAGDARDSDSSRSLPPQPPPPPSPPTVWKPIENVSDECGLARKIYRDALRDRSISPEEKKLRHELLCDCLKRHYPDQWRQECVRPDGTPMFVGFDPAIPPPTTDAGTETGGGRARVPTPTPTSAVAPPPAPTEVSLAPCAAEGASSDVVATVVRHLDNHDHTWCGQYLNRRIRALFTQVLASSLLLALQGLPSPLACSISPPGCAGTCETTFAQLAGQTNVTVRLELTLRNGQVQQGRLVFGFPGQPFEVALAPAN